MSLTSHLKDPTSPVGQFLRSHLPHTHAITSVTNAQLRAAPLLRPPTDSSTYRDQSAYGIVGAAVDYRLRYYFATTPNEDLIAWGGALRSGYPSGLVHDFFAALDQTLDALQPIGCLLEAEADAMLARYCAILALFEEVFRSGVEPPPLVYPARAGSVSDLLGRAEDDWIADICQVSRQFHASCQHLLSRPFSLNPTFAGSQDVGGADADLIVDGCLLELKTTVKTVVEAQWLRQLAGYLLLDYEDAHAIRSVGIYLARHGLLFTWPVEEFLFRLTGDVSTSLSALREDFKTRFRTPDGWASLRPSGVRSTTPHARSFLAIRRDVMVEQASLKECCVVCGDKLTYTAQSGVVRVSRRKKERLIDVIVLRCQTCDIEQSHEFAHPLRSAQIKMV